ncbi:hypothetical protein FKP32DRAFT_685709 [Trametes sanguinea]|nr:hypothetical protein FKP32DRAFT_685709 [Trametes sanguinea]
MGQPTCSSRSIDLFRPPTTTEQEGHRRTKDVEMRPEDGPSRFFEVASLSLEDATGIQPGSRAVSLDALRTEGGAPSPASKHVPISIGLAGMYRRLPCRDAALYHHRIRICSCCISSLRGRCDDGAYCEACSMRRDLELKTLQNIKAWQRSQPQAIRSSVSAFRSQLGQQERTTFTILVRTERRGTCHVPGMLTLSDRVGPSVAHDRTEYVDTVTAQDNAFAYGEAKAFSIHVGILWVVPGARK